MAWDPTQGQEQPGNGEQGQPANGGPEPSSGSSTPQNPYQGQEQPASGAEPYSGYGTPPPQNPYGAPPQNPYGTPPPQNPYANPPEYGTPPYQQGGYGYAPPQQAPRSIGQAIQELPNQYIRVLTKPSPQTFAEEMGKADWAMVWIQLLIWALIGTVIGLIASALRLASSSLIGTGGASFNSFLALTVSGNTFAFISVPIYFFILVGIQYLLAKAFKGEGNFLTQGYTTLLFEVPIYIISYLLGLIPFVGWIAGAALAIYGIVLNVFSIMAVHRLSGGKATGVVLIPVLILLVFLCAFAFIVAAIIIAATRTTTP